MWRSRRHSLGGGGGGVCGTHAHGKWRGFGGGTGMCFRPSGLQGFGHGAVGDGPHRAQPLPRVHKKQLRVLFWIGHAEVQVPSQLHRVPMHLHPRVPVCGCPLAQLRPRLVSGPVTQLRRRVLGRHGHDILHGMLCGCRFFWIPHGLDPALHHDKRVAHVIYMEQRSEAWVHTCCMLHLNNTLHYMRRAEGGAVDVVGGGLKGASP